MRWVYVDFVLKGCLAQAKYIVEENFFHLINFFLSSQIYRHLGVHQPERKYFPTMIKTVPSFDLQPTLPNTQLSLWV